MYDSKEKNSEQRLYLTILELISIIVLITLSFNGFLYINARVNLWLSTEQPLVEDFRENHKIKEKEDDINRLITRIENINEEHFEQQKLIAQQEAKINILLSLYPALTNFDINTKSFISSEVWQLYKQSKEEQIVSENLISALELNVEKQISNTVTLSNSLQIVSQNSNAYSIIKAKQVMAQEELIYLSNKAMTERLILLQKRAIMEMLLTVYPRLTQNISNSIDLTTNDVVHDLQNMQIEIQTATAYSTTLAEEKLLLQNNMFSIIAELRRNKQQAKDEFEKAENYWNHLHIWWVATLTLMFLIFLFAFVWVIVNKLLDTKLKLRYWLITLTSLLIVTMLITYHIAQFSGIVLIVSVALIVLLLVISSKIPPSFQSL